MLRSMNQAVYSTRNAGHFGLALEEYAHFTSPIRRYPDLMVNRAIKHRLVHKSKKDFAYDTARVTGIGEHCSVVERRAEDAVRDVTAWLKCEYMQDQIGQTHVGVISGITSFGAFVELKGIHVEGLLHITSLPHDYYDFDSMRHRLLGRRSGRAFDLGQEVRVVVAAVNLDERKIDFQLDASGQSEGKGKNKGRRKGKGSHRNDDKNHGKRKDKSGKNSRVHSHSAESSAIHSSAEVADVSKEHSKGRSTNQTLEPFEKKVEVSARATTKKKKPKAKKKAKSKVKLKTKAKTTVRKKKKKSSSRSKKTGSQT